MSLNESGKARNQISAGAESWYSGSIGVRSQDSLADGVICHASSFLLVDPDGGFSREEAAVFGILLWWARAGIAPGDLPCSGSTVYRPCREIPSMHS